MPFGATVLPNGGTRFRLWAPACVQVLLDCRGSGDECWCASLMQRDAAGWHELTMDGVGAGTAYRFLVTCEGAAPLLVPDPASRSNPCGVHEYSVVVDPWQFAWRHHDRIPAADAAAWAQAVIYELHIGTFTAAGTFAAAAGHLADLKELGVTALQLMPLAAFAGDRNWGYDGVLQYAPAACYGSPEELKALIDYAHSLDLMVFLDVVYNHFGPEGNYLHVYCPDFFNATRRTPWGAAINFDAKESATVREFFVHNALFWVEEYGFDGLRLDAVHAMHDESSPDIVEAISSALQGKAHVVLEHNGDPDKYLRRDCRGRPLVATAQWDHDVLHTLPIRATGAADRYYAEYATRRPDAVARAVPAAAPPAAAFVGFLQNHDMVGNRPCGDRVAWCADPCSLKAAYACLLLSPGVPLMFMGEEYAASTPFLFFCDFAQHLAPAVAHGRVRELQRFAAFVRDAARSAMLDPNDAMTFKASKLQWQERSTGVHREQLLLIRKLLALRRRHLAPHLTALADAGVKREVDGLLSAEWRLPDASRWRVLVNAGAEYRVLAASAGEPVYAFGVHATDSDRRRFDPAAVCVERLPAAASGAAPPN